MPKTFSDLKRHALNGQTMGTRWSALFHKEAGFDVEPARAAMAEAVAEVDRQMSIWKPDSDLNRLNAAKPGDWIALPGRLLTVMAAGLAIGRASGGALTSAWAMRWPPGGLARKRPIRTGSEPRASPTAAQRMTFWKSIRPAGEPESTPPCVST
jgi:hypothetical protein